MRPIKFRVWDRAHECYCSDENHILAAGVLTEELSHYSLEQFTGLLDKNGKEIYEGDILLVSGEYPRHYTDPQGGWEVKFTAGTFNANGTPLHVFLDAAYHTGEWIEVIGNIHETEHRKSFDQIMRESDDQ